MKTTTRMIMLLVAFTAQAVWAATNVWTGAGIDDNWSTPANWSLEAAPAAGDVARFDATSSKDCAIDNNVGLGSGGILITADYGGTVSQGASTITLGDLNFVQEGGAFVGGSGAITVNGSFFQSGGSFTATSGRLQLVGNRNETRYFHRSGGIFNHNDGEVYFAPTSNSPTPHMVIVANGCIFYDFTLDYALYNGTNGDVRPTDDFTVANNFKIFGNRTTGKGSRFNPTTPVTVTIKGSLIKEDGYNISLGNANVTFLLAEAGQRVICGQGGFGASLLFSGSGDQYITNHLNNTYNNTLINELVVDKSNGQVAACAHFRVASLLVETGNTFDAGYFDIWPPTIGGYLRNYGTVLTKHPNLDVQILSSSSFNIYSGSLIWSNVTFRGEVNTGSPITLEDDITITGNLWLNGTTYRGALFAGDGKTITVKGDCTLTTGGAATIATKTSTLLLAGTKPQSLASIGNSITFNPALVIASGADVTLTNALTAQSAVTTMTCGSFDLSGHDLTVKSGGLNVSGTLRLQGDEAVTAPALAAGSVVVYTGAENPVTVPNWSYKGLAFAAPGKIFNWTAGATYSVAEAFTAAGAAKDKVIFRSTIADERWLIDIKGATTDMTRVDVKDSEVVNGVIHTTVSVNAGNTVNWRFGGYGTTVLVR